MKKLKKAIGIISGMGPEASQHFYKLLISYAQKDYQVEKNEDFPEIYLASIPVPDFISDEKREKEALEMLENRVMEMDKLPISFFCMACNTGHLLINKLRKQTEKPFVSLIEEVPRFIKKQKIKKIEDNKILIQQIAKRLLRLGAEGIIESCTEIPLIFPKQHLVPVFDTLEILAEAVLKK